jgi:hypothetical protein
MGVSHSSVFSLKPATEILRGSLVERYVSPASTLACKCAKGEASGTGHFGI